MATVKILTEAGLYQKIPKEAVRHLGCTARIICDRGVSHEVVRHRIASYSQESTRYVNYGRVDMKFINPSDFTLDEEDMKLLEAIECHYNKCLDNGRTPQQARYFLPNGLKTELIMTANFNSWNNFFKLRLPKSAHPDMRVVAGKLYEQMHTLFPTIFTSSIEGCFRESKSNHCGYKPHISEVLT